MLKKLLLLLAIMIVPGLPALAEYNEKETASFTIHYSNDIIGYLVPCG